MPVSPYILERAYARWLGPVFVFVALSPAIVAAQLQTVADQEPQRVFAGEARKIMVQLRNPGAAPVQADLRLRLYQASSATAIPLGEIPWKQLQVLPGQTVVESATLRFPMVRAETLFLVQWVEGAASLLGVTEVLVYPPTLLETLRPLLGDEPLGVFDPEDQLKPLLQSNKVEVLDLEDRGFGSFHGKLALIGPFSSKAQVPEGLGKRIKSLASKGMAVVWIQPSPERHQELKPSFYTVLEGKGAVVVVQCRLTANLPESPQAQLNLVQLVRLALHPEPARLPDLTVQQ